MVSSAPNSPGGAARSRQDTGANLLQELEALSQALYKASQAQNIGHVGAQSPTPRKEAESHLTRRETMPARVMNDVFSKNPALPGVSPPSQGPARKLPQARHSISARPSAALFGDHSQEEQWKQSRPARHSLAVPRTMELREADVPAPRLERKLQPWHSQGFEQNLPEVTNFPAWLEDNINFSKKLEAPAEKKKSIWNWKPFRTLSHIGHTRHNCLFTVHVHAIEGLPPAMNGLRLTVHWRHKDRTAQTMPSRVFQGSAEFEESLQLRCSVYGHKSAHHAVKYMPKAFTLCVIALDVDELMLGQHRLDLSRLLPEVPDGEHEDEDKPLSWTTSFKLSGKAKGGTLVVTFGYEILMKEKNDKSGRFGSVIGSPSPSMPSPSLRSFQSLPHSAHGTPRPRPSDVNHQFSPTLSEPGDYHDYHAMEHLNLDESTPPDNRGFSNSSSSSSGDPRAKLYGRPDFNSSRPPKGLFPESKFRTPSPGAAESLLAPSTPKQIVEPGEPSKGSILGSSARDTSYGSSEEDDPEFIVVDQGVEVGTLPENIISHGRITSKESSDDGSTPEHIAHRMISTRQQQVVHESSSTPDPDHIAHGRATTPDHIAHGGAEHSIFPRASPRQPMGHGKFVGREPMDEGEEARPPPEKIVHEGYGSINSSSVGRRTSPDREIQASSQSQDIDRGSFTQTARKHSREEKRGDEQHVEAEDRSTRFEAASQEDVAYGAGAERERAALGKLDHDDDVTPVPDAADEKEVEEVALDFLGGQDVEEIPATVGLMREEREEEELGSRQPEEHKHRAVDLWETALSQSSASGDEENREPAQENEMWRNMNAAVSRQSVIPPPADLNNRSSVSSPIDDLDDEVDLIAGEFLHMLGDDTGGRGGGGIGLSSDSENDSPRALLLKQFEQEALLEGGIGLRLGVPEMPELNLDEMGDGPGRGEESGLHSEEYALGWQSEEDLELASIMEAAESELQKATQTMRSKTRAKMLEDAETEALMQEWGLNERAFQSSPPKPAQGFLDSMSNQMSRAPAEPPALAQGVGSVLQTKDGGMLRSLNPALFPQGGNNSGRLVMQVSKPVVVPSEMGSSGLDIFRRMASGGLDAMALQAMVAMPLEDITGKSVHQIAYESKVALEGPASSQNYLPAHGHSKDLSHYEGMDLGRRRGHDLGISSRSKSLSSTGRHGGYSDSSDEFVNLEELAPMAMQKIEALAMDGLKIQADMTDEIAPYSVDALPYADMEGSKFKKGGIGSLDGVAAMHLLDSRNLGEDTLSVGNDGLMSKVISIDEWMRLDAGMYDENDTKDETLAILAAHGAVHKDVVARGSRDDRIRYLQGAKASANFGKGGFMGNVLTIAMLVQLRDPLRNNEPVGAPMMALVQAERVIVPPRPKIPRRAPSLLGNSEKWNDEDEVQAEAPPPLQFKITAVHMSGLKPAEEPQSKQDQSKQQKKTWGNQKQQQSGSRWLLANGMGKNAPGSKHPALKSKPQATKTTVKPGESLWSISARVHGTGSKWKEVAALNPHIRNPDVIFANQKIRTR